MSLFHHKKKLLLLFCSPHGGGRTRQLADGFLRPFAGEDWEIGEFDVFRENPRPCDGCGQCAKKEGCAHPDLDGLDKLLRDSDLLVIASPVYNAGFPAPMKAVLDRWQRYFEARFSLGKKPPIPKRREAVLLLVQGSGEEFPAEAITYQLRRAFSVMNTELTGCAVWPGTDLGDQGKGEALRKAEELALAIKQKL